MAFPTNPIYKLIKNNFTNQDDGVANRSAGHSAMIISDHADAYLGFSAEL